MAHRRGSFEKKISYTHWTTFSVSSLAFGAGVTGVLVSAAQHERETLLRIRGESMIYADGAQAPGALTVVAAGLILVPEGTGTTVLWSPFTDGDAPWIWSGFYHIGHEEAVTDVLQVPQLPGARDVIDNKAMRILRNQEVQAVWENVTLGGAVTINAMMGGRILTGK